MELTYFFFAGPPVLLVVITIVHLRLLDWQMSKHVHCTGQLLNQEVLTRTACAEDSLVPNTFH